MTDIEASLRLDIAQYQQSLAKAQGETKRVFERMKKEGKGLGMEMFKPLAGLAAGGVLVGLGKTTLDTVVKLDRMKRALTTLEGGSVSAEARLRELSEVAKLPGIGFEQAVDGDVRLRAVGISAETSKQALIEFGNALALSGGTAADLDGVILALGQIASKGKVSAEEINQIAERVPQIRAVMQNVFGTADTEAIQKMGITAEDFITRTIGGFGDLKRATAGLDEDLSDISQSFSMLLNEVGGPLVNELVPGMRDLATWAANNKEGFAAFGAVAVGAVEGIGSALVAVQNGFTSVSDMLAMSAYAVSGGGTISENFDAAALALAERDVGKTGSGSSTPYDPSRAKSSAASGSGGSGVGSKAVAENKEIEDTKKKILEIQGKIKEEELLALPAMERLRAATAEQAAIFAELQQTGGLFAATLKGMGQLVEERMKVGNIEGAQKTLEQLQKARDLQKIMDGASPAIDQQKELSDISKAQLSLREAELKSRMETLTTEQQIGEIQRQQSEQQALLDTGILNAKTALEVQKKIVDLKSEERALGLQMASDAFAQFGKDKAEQDKVLAQQQGLEIFKAEMAIIDAQAAGQTKKAEAMQRALDIAQLAKQLQDQMNVSEAEALRLATQRLDAEKKAGEMKGAASRYDANGMRADGRHQIKGYSQSQGDAGTQQMEAGAARQAAYAKSEAARAAAFGGLDKYNQMQQTPLRDTFQFPQLNQYDQLQKDPLAGRAQQNAAVQDRRAPGTGGVDAGTQQGLQIMQQMLQVLTGG